ncbi:MAG: RcnB family protein [Sphingobium sp.]
MRKLVLTGLMASLVGVAAPAVQAENAGNLALATSLMNNGAVHAVPGRGGVQGAGHTWGPRVNGRWSAGWNAPGGWNGYHRPTAGFTLPGYWINPSYYISDYRGYGLPAPAYGYGWSRYYDDAVLTDRYGRVTDVRYGYDWDRFGGYDDSTYDDGGNYRDDERRGNSVAGAVVGGVVGGVAGNLIGGRGNRLPGTIIGAGVGAVAGAAIAGANDRDRGGPRPAPGYDAPGYAPRGYDAPSYAPGYDDGAPRENTGARVPYYYGAPRGGEPYPYSDGAIGPDGRPVRYDGQWVGTWYGQDGRVYSGTYDGQFTGKAKGKRAKTAYARPYAPAYRPAPLPGPAYGYGYDYSASSYGAGYGASSYAYEATDYVAPTVTTTVTTEETTYATVRKAVRKAAPRRPAPKRRVVCCPCGC